MFESRTRMLQEGWQLASGAPATEWHRRTGIWGLPPSLTLSKSDCTSRSSHGQAALQAFDPVPFMIEQPRHALTCFSRSLYQNSCCLQKATSHHPTQGAHLGSCPYLVQVIHSMSTSMSACPQGVSVTWSCIFLVPHHHLCSRYNVFPTTDCL